MNSSTIAAVVPSFKPQAGRSSAADTGEADASRSFADVLAGQGPESTEEQTQAGLMPTSSSAARDAAATDADASINKAVEADPTVQEEDQTVYSLPGIALEIALHARDQAAARANPASIQSDPTAVAKGSVNSVADAHSRNRGADAVGVALRQTLASDQATASSDTLDTTTLADSRAQASASAGLPAQPTVGAVELLNSPTGQQPASAATRRATPSAVAAASLAAGTTIGKQADAQTGNAVSARGTSTAEIAFTFDAGPQPRDAQANPSGAPAGIHTELSAALSGAAVNPFSPPGTPASLAAPAIATPLQQPGWNADFSRQVVTLAHNAQSGTQTAELRLDPPELGPLRISISLNEGMASALFVSAHASVRQAIESALPQLSQQLAQAGISLGDTHVGEHGQAGFAFNEQAGQQQGNPSGSRTGGAASVDVTHAPRATVTGNNLVDTFA